MEKISSKFAEMNTYNILHTQTHTLTHTQI